MLKDYLRLAINSLSKRRLRAWLTMIGIFIGIAAVVSLISLGEGMQKAIEEQFFALGADKVTIQTKGVATGPPGSNTNVKLTEGDLKIVQKVNGVTVATDRIIEPITAKFNNREKYLYAASLPQEPEERKMVLSVADIEIISGRNLRPNDQKKVIMSEDYLEPKFNGKGLKVGDKILIENEQFDVVGIFKKTGNPFVDMSFVINEKPLRDLLDLPDKVGLIVAELNDPDNAELIVNTIKKDLRNYRNVDEGKEDFDVQTAEDVLDTFKTVISIVQAVLVGIAAISLIVGGIGIMNTMYTSVLERKDEIGIMKAIGARNSDVLQIFLFESGLLGMIGSVIGLLLGIGLSKLVELIAYQALGSMLIKAHFPTWLIIGALLFGFIIGSLAGVLPARQASMLQPVEALRE